MHATTTATITQTISFSFLLFFDFGLNAIVETIILLVA